MTRQRHPGLDPRVLSRQLVHCPIVYSDGDFFATGMMENYAVGGICVRGTRPVTMDKNLVVFFVPPRGASKALVRLGTVRWIHGTVFGIALTEVCPDSEAELSRLASVHLPTLWSSLN